MYASERLESRAYIEANRELDAKLARLKREKREIAAGVLPLDAETVLDTSIRTFCEDAKAKFNASADPDARRAFLAGRIERIIYRKHQVTIVGAVPLPSIDGDEVRKAAFRIAGEIDIEAVKSRPRPTKPGDGRFRTWNPKYARASPPTSPDCANCWALRRLQRRRLQVPAKTSRQKSSCRRAHVAAGA